ncbi:MAG: SEL1-like repeat protein [Gammaproteobacteria bacterium]|nr:SEL1-like repeat protein [Gammaproteobacteria bacterium]NNJ71859.1 sel1 repeat family protein [Enterobacterales bacterium]
MPIKVTLLFAFLLLNVSTFTASDAEKEPHLTCFDDCAKAMSELQEFANNGSPHAQTLLALTYKTGELYGKVNRDKAWRWMSKAKNQSFPPAMYLLSQWYRSGFHTDINKSEANRYLLRAATYGYAPAMYEYGVRQMSAGDNETGLRYIQAASDANYRRADNFLEELDESKQRVASASKTASGIDDMLSEDKITDNVLTIVGNKIEPETFLINVLAVIKEQSVYSDKGTTGSRIASVKCGQPGSGCRVIDDNNSVDLWLNKGLFGR